MEVNGVNAFHPASPSCSPRFYVDAPAISSLPILAHHPHGWSRTREAVVVVVVVAFSKGNRSWSKSGWERGERERGYDGEEGEFIEARSRWLIPKEIIEDASPRFHVRIQIGPLEPRGGVVGPARGMAENSGGGEIRACMEGRCTGSSGGTGATGRASEIAGFSVPQVLFVIIKPTPLPLYLY